MKPENYSEVQSLMTTLNEINQVESVAQSLKPFATDPDVVKIVSANADNLLGELEQLKTNVVTKLADL